MLMLKRDLRGLNRLAIAAAATLLAGGCASSPPPATAPSADVDWLDQSTPDKANQTEIMLVDSIRDSGIRNAILAQHTLYPYHFVSGGDALNDLGKRDLAVLVTQYKTYGGELSIRQGDATDPVYNARVRFVEMALADDGVDLSKIHITDSPSGGETMRSEEVQFNIQNLRDRETKDNSSSQSGSGGQTETTSGSSGGGNQ
jgi:hypothetical protein